MGEPPIVSFPSWVGDVIVDGYKQKGVSGLFQWQDSLLQIAYRHTSNVAYSAPTSAGKSLVAELLAYKTATDGKKVLFILPYISVAREKYLHLQKLWSLVDLPVAGFMGHHSSQTRDWMCAVCTMEKANSLVNRMILDDSISDIGLVVIDEMHMISDGSRGGTLEYFVSKLLFLQESLKTLRLLGMSATLTRKQEVEKWFKSELFETDFRPIQLTETILVEDEIIEMHSMNRLRSIAGENIYDGDSDRIIGLSVESIISGALTLVFCSSKADVEKIAKDIARTVAIHLPRRVDLQNQIDRNGLLELKVELERLGPIDKELCRTLPRGIGFHHAGLTSEERECIENAFRKGVIRILVATSTLSSGVNLPAKRVLIRAQVRGPAAINSTTYRQMAGRAGRMGQTESGESILIVKKGEYDIVKRLITEPPDKGNDVVRDPRKVVLEAICSGMCKTDEDVRKLFECLLYPTIRDAEQTVQELEGLKLISTTKLEGGSVLVAPTQLGTAALASSLPPDAALFVFEDLRRACRGLCLETELQMLYLVTPVNISVWAGADWNRLHVIYTTLSDENKRISRLIGVQEAVILACIQGRHIENNKMQLHLRFFSALALFDVVNELPLQEVADKFGVNRGALQSLQLQSATYAAMVVAFCARLGWTYMKSLLESFASRLAFGVRRELTELVKLPGIDGCRARAFHESGITSLGELANAEPRTIAAVLTSAVPFQCSAENDGLGEWLYGEGRMKLEDAVAELIRRADNAVTEQIRELGLLPESQLERIRKKRDVEVSQRVNNEAMEIQEQLTQSAKRLCSQLEQTHLESDTECDGGYEDKTEVGMIEEKSPNKASQQNFVAQTCPAENVSMKDSGYGSLTCTRGQDCSTRTLDTSLDLFSQSIADMSLEDVAEPQNSTLDKVESSQMYLLGEVDSLEQNLNSEVYTQRPVQQQSELPVQPIMEDSFDVDRSFIKNSSNTQKKRPISNRRSAVEDSFDAEITRILEDKENLVDSFDMTVFGTSDELKRRSATKSDIGTLLKQRPICISNRRSAVEDSFDAEITDILEEKENLVDSFDVTVFGTSDKAKRRSASKSDSGTILRRSLLKKRTEEQITRNADAPNEALQTKRLPLEDISSPSVTPTFTFDSPQLNGAKEKRRPSKVSFDEAISEADTSADLFGTSLSSVGSPQRSLLETSISIVTSSNKTAPTLLPIASEEMVQTRSASKHQREVTPVRRAPTNKRLRQNDVPRSPSTASPMAKSVKKDPDERVVISDSEAALKRAHSQDLRIDDVCRTESSWMEFRSSARNWHSIGLGVAFKRYRSTENVVGVAMCAVESDPIWISFSDEQFYGNDEEETAIPSSTPCDQISLKDRVDAVSNILSNCDEVFVFDAMRVCAALRRSFPEMFVQNPIDVSYLAFLALLRQGERPLPLVDLLHRCNFTMDTKKYFHGSTRIRAALTAFVLPSIFWQIRPNAVKQSSERSVILELNAMGVAVRMMMRGIRFDVQKCNQKQKVLSERMDEISEECQKFAGRHVDLNSSKDVAKVLFTRLKLPYPGNSNTRSKSTSKETLQQITQHHPMPGMVIEYRRIHFSISNHIHPLRECLLPPSDTLHPNLDLFTATGRLISSHPNIQNVTKEELIPGFGVRHLFVAREGYMFVSADYSQLELRVMAHLSGDPKLVALFRERNRDIFSEMAKEMCYDRNSVKTLCYGIIYGIGARSLAEMLKCPQKDASKLISSFFQTYPKVQSYIANVKEDAKNEKFVKTALGRKRLTSSSVGQQSERAKDDRQSVNFTIQGTASEIFKFALVELERRLKDIDGFIVLPIHDEVLCEVPEKHVDKAGVIIRECMEGAFQEIKVSLFVKTAIGRCWADMEK